MSPDQEDRSMESISPEEQRPESLQENLEGNSVTVLSYESDASWCTNWEYNSESSIDNTFSSAQGDSSMGSLSPEEASRIIFSSNSVHGIFSIRQQLADCYSNFSSLGCLSIQESGSLQINLESNNAPIQRHPRLKEPTLYDVDQKIFNSIDYQPSTEFSEYESLDRLRLPDHSSFNSSTTQETIQNPQIGLPNNLEIDGVSMQESQSVEENLVPGNKIVPLPLEDKKSKLELKLKEKEDQLKEKEQRLDELYKTISMKNKKIKDLSYQKAQIEEVVGLALIQKRKFKQARQKANKLESELYEAISTQNQEIKNLHHQNVQLNKAYDQSRQYEAYFNRVCQDYAGLQKELEREGQKYSAQKRAADVLARKNYQLAEDKDLLSSRFKDLEDKNTKLLAASGQGRKQSNYASTAFVIAGIFAFGASLTMFHLVICISLAVAALTFLAVGCYCSYKANTALSNVEVDNCVNPAVVEV